MPMPPLTVSRVSDVVAEALERRILDGTFAPGTRLPAERALALELGVSRTTLRQAIQTLVARHLLSTRHGGGHYVTDSLQAPFVNPWQEMLEGHPSLQVDMLEFRDMLDSRAAALAAERATSTDLDRLDHAFAALERAYETDDMPHTIATDVAFHLEIADCARNVVIRQLTSGLMRVIHKHVSRNLCHLHERPERWSLLRGQHRAIWQAIHEHDPAKAAAAARAHITFVQDSLAESARDEERRHGVLRHKRMGTS